jgi:two-component system, NtrC family, sensor kinase
MNEPAIKATLLVIRGVDQGSRLELDGEDVSVGRGVNNRFRILDTEMSRNHLVIRDTPDGFLLQDRNSSNGTFVNGVAVKTHLLNSGDQIQIGRTTLLFTSLSDSERQVAVDLVAPHGHDDASQIVGKASLDAGRRLFEKSTSTQPDRSARNLANLQLLYRMSEEMVSSSLSIEQLLQRILDTTLNAVGADRGCMLVADPRTGQLAPRVAAHREGLDQTARMPVSRSIVDYVLKQSHGVRTSDARADSRFASGASIMSEGIREAMCVPMPGRYELMGVIYVDTTSQFDPQITADFNSNKFNDEQLNLLAAIGRQAALAVEDHRYQDAYVKAERLAAIGETIAIMSHHIKNILQGVRGGGYLIGMGLQDHDETMIRQGWAVVEKNQDRIYHLVMDMLTFSTERQPKLEPGNINDVVRDVQELMQVRSEELGIELRVSTDKELPTAMFDPEGIHRAVLNIVINAMEAVDTHSGGVVEILTGGSDDGAEIWVDVVDNGAGIPDEALATIFNIFESNKGARGSGIGLAVSQKILKEHGGEIVVDSQLNSGSRFRLIWPSLEDEGRVSVQKNSAK